MMNELIFVGFNSQVVALHRDSGEVIWRWRCPKGSGYVTLLLDGDRLIASVIGYMYCLDPATGNQLWFNELAGFGTGVASLASVRGCVQPLLDAAAAEEAAAAGASSVGCRRIGVIDPAAPSPASRHSMSRSCRTARASDSHQHATGRRAAARPPLGGVRRGMLLE